MTYHSKKQYTVNEVADLLGVSSRKVYYLIKDGSLPSTKFGGSPSRRGMRKTMPSKGIPRRVRTSILKGVPRSLPRGFLRRTPKKVV